MLDKINKPQIEMQNFDFIQIDQTKGQEVNISKISITSMNLYYPYHFIP